LAQSVNKRGLTSAEAKPEVPKGAEAQPEFEVPKVPQIWGGGSDSYSSDTSEESAVSEGSTDVSEQKWLPSRHGDELRIGNIISYSNYMNIGYLSINSATSLFKYPFVAISWQISEDTVGSDVYKISYETGSTRYLLLAKATGDEIHVILHPISEAIPLYSNALWHIEHKGKESRISQTGIGDQRLDLAELSMQNSFMLVPIDDEWRRLYHKDFKRREFKKLVGIRPDEKVAPVKIVLSDGLVAGFDTSSEHLESLILNMEIGWNGYGEDRYTFYRVVKGDKGDVREWLLFDEGRVILKELTSLANSDYPATSKSWTVYSNQAWGGLSEDIEVSERMMIYNDLFDGIKQTDEWTRLDHKTALRFEMIGFFGNPAKPQTISFDGKLFVNVRVEATEMRVTLDESSKFTDLVAFISTTATFSDASKVFISFIGTNLFSVYYDHKGALFTLQKKRSGLFEFTTNVGKDQTDCSWFIDYKVDERNLILKVSPLNAGIRSKFKKLFRETDP